MKALTVKQPYAWAILHAEKTVENRTHEWTYRGPLLIHSSKRVLAPDVIAADDTLCSALHQAGVDPADLDAAMFPGGVILGVVTLVDVHRATERCCASGWAHRPRRSPFDLREGLDTSHLVLANPIALRTPLSASGTPGLWNPLPNARRMAAYVLRQHTSSAHLKH